METGYNKFTELQDINVMSVSTGSNHSEISKAMEKTNQLLAQQQMAQQKTTGIVILPGTDKQSARSIAENSKSSTNGTY